MKDTHETIRPSESTNPRISMGVPNCPFVPTRLSPAQHPAHNVKRTGKSVLLSTTPSVKENGFSYPFIPSSAPHTQPETDWKVRPPFHHTKRKGERVFLPVYFLKHDVRHTTSQGPLGDGPAPHPPIFDLFILRNASPT